MACRVPLLSLLVVLQIGLAWPNSDHLLEHHASVITSMGNSTVTTLAGEFDGAAAIGPSVGFVKSVAEGSKNPNVKQVGSVMESAGGLIATCTPLLGPAAPVGLVVAGVVSGVGALLEVFGPGGDEPPSNADVISAMNKGFAHINVKLDHITKEVDVLYEDVHFGVQKFTDIRAHFKEYMERLHAAQSDPSDLPDAKSYAINAAEKLSHYKNSMLSPDSIQGLLETKSHNDNCMAAASTFQDVILTRTELFALEFHAQVYRHQKIDGIAVVDAKRFHDDVAAYKQTADTMHLALSQQDQADCNRSISFKSWTQLTPCCVSSIAINSRFVYGLNNQGLIYRATKQTDNWQGNLWVPMTRCCMVQISVDEEHIFGLGTDGLVWKASSHGGAWSQVTWCCMAAIAVGTHDIFAIGTDQLVWRAPKDGDGSYNAWMQVTVCCMTPHIAVDDLYVYSIGTDGIIWRAPQNGDGSHQTWVAIATSCHEGTCGFRQIAVDGAYVYVIGGDGETYKAPKHNNEAAPVGQPGEATLQDTWVHLAKTANDDIAVDGDFVYGVHSGSRDVWFIADNVDNWLHNPHQPIDLVVQPTHSFSWKFSLVAIGAVAAAPFIWLAKMHSRKATVPFEPLLEEQCS